MLQPKALSILMAFLIMNLHEGCVYATQVIEIWAMFSSPFYWMRQLQTCGNYRVSHIAFIVPASAFLWVHVKRWQEDNGG